MDRSHSCTYHKNPDGRCGDCCGEQHQACDKVRDEREREWQVSLASWGSAIVFTIAQDEITYWGGSSEFPMVVLHSCVSYLLLVRCQQVVMLP